MNDFDAPERPISPTVRIFVALCAGLGAWQLAWIADQTDRLVATLPAPWSATFWQVAWGVVLFACAAAAITGRDLPTRIALVAVTVVSGMGIVTVIMDARPMGVQFWPVGQAAVIGGSAFGLLLAPLRPPPEVDDWL